MELPLWKPWFATKLECKNDEEEKSRVCVQVASADSGRLREIEAGYEALLVTCGNPVYLVVDELRPCVL